MTSIIFISLKLGPFLDTNNDLLSSGDIQYTFEELIQNIFDKISLQLKK